MVSSTSADVVIVGGGIVGVSTAYLLAKEGVSSVIVEKDSVGSHASGFAYGGLSRPRGAGPNVPVLAESWRLHERFGTELPEETGVNTEFRLRPSLSLAFTDEEAAQLRASLDWQRHEEGPSVRWVDAKEVFEIEPRVNPEAIGGVYVEGGGDVEPYRLTLALVQAAEREGATVRHGTVTGLRVVGGRVRGVALEGGEIACETVVLAMGPWSAQAAEWLGVPVPVRPLKGQILRLQAPGDPFRCSLGYAGDYATTKPDGLLWTGTTEEEAGFDDRPTAAARDKIMASLLKMVPSLEDARLAQQTACLRPVSSDGQMLLGRAPGTEGAFVATAGGRQGIMLGPGMAKVVMELITRGSTDVEIEGLDPARFCS